MAESAKQRLDKHDRQIAATRDLIREGKRLGLETRKDIRALSAAQNRTDKTLRDFIASLRRGGNGNGKTLGVQ